MKRRVETPLGPVLLIGTEHALCELRLHATDGETEGRSPVLERAATQLSEYFEGKRTEFDVPLAPDGTEFQQDVWRALQQVGFGETVSYVDIARTVGSPKGSRAVGQANGKNPIAIIVPCHRVVAANGGLGGYTGGLDVKRWLLDHEAKVGGFQLRG